MSVHLTEEEQLEVLKRWWKDYGKTVVGVVAAAVILYVGWTKWQEQKHAKMEAVSAQYESLLKLVNVAPGKTMSDDDRATAEHIAGELKANSGKSMYAYSAAFFLTKLAVTSGDLDKAVKELQWILSSKPDVATAQLAHTRLARVLISKGAFDEAQAQLKEEPTKAFASEYAEIRGDILKGQGNKDAALTAYQKALETTDAQQQERTMLLQMKIDELKTPVAVAQGAAQ